VAANLPKERRVRADRKLRGFMKAGQFVEPDQSDLPDGLFASLAVQPLLQKYFPSRSTQIKSITPAIPSHRGALAIVTDAGRDAVDAGSAHLTNGADADGEVVWF
jgi:hypothetical protein